ncbi:hypothetical protein MHYP_G00163810 [Metynnis hypsauchen]
MAGEKRGRRSNELSIFVFPRNVKKKRDRGGEEEIRQTEERRAKELYISLKQEERESERDDKEWQEQLRRSKAADEEMKCKARRARDEYKTPVPQGIEKGLVAGLSGLFQKTHLNGSGQNRRHSSVIEQSATPAEASHSPAAVGNVAAPVHYRRRQNRRYISPVTHSITEGPVWIRPPRPTSRDSILRWFKKSRGPEGQAISGAATLSLPGSTE